MKSLSRLWRNKLPVRPVEVRAIYRDRKKISVVVFQNNLSLLAALQVDSLDPVCTRIAPVQFIFLKNNFKTNFSYVSFKVTV